MVYDIVQDVYNGIKNKIFSSDPIIEKILSKIFTHNGKGIRPVFMELVAKLSGGGWINVREAAMVIETIHIASLIHDDVVDSSELRRGAATLNVRYSDKISVLFGDYIFIKALSKAYDIDDPEAVSIIYEAVERMIEGVIRETLSDFNTDEEAYLSIIGNKTASLFAASGELGVVLSGGDSGQKRWARELGESVGMAFQIVDDTLDFTGETEVMGKRRFMDVMSGRVTLPVIHSLKGLTSDEISGIFNGQDESIKELTNLVALRGGIEYSYEKAREYTEKAQGIVNHFGNKNAQNIFKGFFDMLMNRTS